MCQIVLPAGFGDRPSGMVTVTIHHLLYTEYTTMYHKPLIPLLISLLLVTATLLGGCGEDDADAENRCDLTGDGPADELVFVGNSDSEDVSVVNPRTCTVEKTIPVGVATTDSNTTPDGRWAFLSSSTDDVVTIIDTDTLEVEKQLETGVRPVHMFFGPDHEKLWVSNDHSASVSVIDVETLTVEKTIDVGEGHKKMAVTDADPYRVYASNINDDTVSVINSADLSVEATIDGGERPHGMDYAASSSQVYNCVDGDVPGIEVIATDGEDANTIVDVIELSERCGYLHIAPDGVYGWAVSSGADQVIVFDTDDDTVVAELAVESRPDKIAFFEGGVAGVAHVGAPEVTLIDTEAFEIIDHLPVGGAHVDPETGRGHRFIQESVDGRFGYVPNSHDGTLSILDIERHAVRGTVDVGDHPMPMAVGGPSGGVAYPR